MIGLPESGMKTFERPYSGCHTCKQTSLHYAGQQVGKSPSRCTLDGFRLSCLHCNLASRFIRLYIKKRKGGHPFILLYGNMPFNRMTMHLSHEPGFAGRVCILRQGQTGLSMLGTFHSMGLEEVHYPTRCKLNISTYLNLAAPSAIADTVDRSFGIFACMLWILACRWPNVY